MDFFNIFFISEVILSVETVDDFYENSNGELYCNVTNSIPLSLYEGFEWHKDEIFLNEANLDELNANISYDGRVLAFNNLTDEAEGFYKCVLFLKNGQKFESNSFSLNTNKAKGK